MKSTTILFKSSTYAYKAKKLFSRKGIDATVIKLNRSRSSGCEYGVDIPNHKIYDAISILRGAEIEYTVYQGE